MPTIKANILITNISLLFFIYIPLYTFGDHIRLLTTDKIIIANIKVCILLIKVVIIPINNNTLPSILKSTRLSKLAKGTKAVPVATAKYPKLKLSRKKDMITLNIIVTIEIIKYILNFGIISAITITY